MTMAGGAPKAGRLGPGAWGASGPGLDLRVHPNPRGRARPRWPRAMIQEP